MEINATSAHKKVANLVAMDDGDSGGFLLLLLLLFFFAFLTVN